jgi:N-acetylglutamate synthase-like GNAT family acetyltransferase
MGLEISSDKARLDRDMIHSFLSTEAYWSIGIPRELVERALDNSLCFGAWLDGRQIGFARVVTDGATFAYLCDVFVLQAHRGGGVARAIMAEVTRHPALTGLRRFMLATADAHDLYRQFGFAAPAKPETLMEISRPDIYRQAPQH